MRFSHLRALLSVSLGAAFAIAALWTAQPANATTVTGKLTTPTGTAVSSASITIRDNGWSVYNWTQTGSDGSFSFSNVPSCSCILQIWANNTEYADPDDRSVEVTGETLDLGTVTLASHNIIGTLTLPDGTTPATSIGVGLNDSSYTIYRYFSSNGSTGQFRFRVPSAGTYTLKVYSDFTSNSVTYYAPSDTTVTVTDPATTLDLGTVKMKNPNVTGTAKDGATAISGASFTAHNSNWTISRWTSSASDGSFGFYLPTGTYTLEPYFPYSTYAGRNPDPQTFTVTEGQTTSLGTISPATANFFLKLTKADGTTAVSNASVNVHTANWTTSKYGTTDVNGNVSLALTTAATYTVEIWLGYDPSFTESRPDNFTFTYSSGNVYYDGTNSSSVVKTQGPAMRGKVTKADGTAVQNASIYLYDASYMNSRWASTDASGLFQLDSVPTAAYTLQVTPPWDATNLVAPDKISVSLVKGETNTTYQTTPIVLATAQKTITVTVKRENGNAVTDASVNAWIMDGSGSRWGQVDANGQYVMTVGKGKWQISTWPNWTGSTTPDWTFSGKSPVTVEFTQANTVAESASVTLTVESYTATITGTVQNPDGTVPSGYTSISIWSQSGKGNWAQADASGSFSVKVAPDTYTVSLYTSSTTYASPELAPVTVKDGETKALGIIKLVTMSGRIKGSVSDSNNKALSGQSVSAWRKNASGWASATTDANGNYSLNVSPGTWMVNAYPSWCGYGDCSNTTQYSASYDPIEVIVNENETKENVNFVFAIKDATIKGTVQDESGNVLDSYGWVEARATDSAFSWSNTGSNASAGKFSIAVVGGKSYNLGMWTSWGADYSMKSAEPVTVTAGQTVENAVIKMVRKDATVSGSVKDENGNVLTDITGSVYANCGPSSYEWAAFSSGTYTLKLSPGTCTIDYWVDYRLKDFYKKPLPDSGKVTVASGETKTLDITLQKLDSVISGKVYGPDGNVLPNAYISADTELGGKKKESSVYSTYGGNFELAATSDSDGNFTLKVPAGSYFVSPSVATGLGYINPKVQEVTVSASSPASLTFNFLRPDATITGSVTIGTTATSVRSFSQFRAANGQATPPSFVSGWSDSGGMVSYFTNDGTYTLNVAGGDTWHVSASYTDSANSKVYKSKEYLVTPEKNGTATQNIAMELQNVTLPNAETLVTSTDVTSTVTMDDGTTVTIPANSIQTENNTPVQITITATPTADLLETADANLAEGYGLDIEITYKEGTKAGQKVEGLTQNAVIAIAYDETALTAAGIDETKLGASTWNEAAGSWDQPDSIVVDTTNNKVSMTVDHFSSYAIVTSAATAVAPTLTLTSPTDGSTVLEDGVTLAGSVTDAAATVTYTLNSGTAQTVTVASGGTFSATVTGLGVGSNTITVNATNNAGSAQAVTRTVIYTRASKLDSSNRIIVTTKSGTRPYAAIVNTKGKVIKKFALFPKSVRADVRTIITDLNGDGTEEIVAYTGAGQPARVRIFSTAGKLLGTFTVQTKSYRGGITVIAADLNGDGVKEIVAAPLSGKRAQVRIYTMRGALVKAFTVSSIGTVSLASGDLDGDYDAELLVGTVGKSKAQIHVYNIQGTKSATATVYTKYAATTFSLTTADTDGNGDDEVIIAAGPRTKGEVRVYNGATPKLLKKFSPFGTNYRSGLRISAGDVSGDGRDDIVVSKMSGPAQIKVYGGDAKQLIAISALASKVRGDINTVTTDISGDAYAEVIVAPGAGLRQPMRIYDHTKKLQASFYPFGTKFSGGYNVSVIE